MQLTDQLNECLTCSMIDMQLGGSGGGFPQWATSLIIFGSCVLVTTLVLVAAKIVHTIAERRAGTALSI